MTLWTVVAFALGVFVGWMTARSAGQAPGSGGLQPGASAARGFPKLKPPPAPFGDPNSPYRIVLLQSGPNKIKTIKAIREVVRADLKTAKDLAEAAPTELVRLATRQEAEEIKRFFAGVAPVRIDGPGPGKAGPDAAGTQGGAAESV